MTDEQYKELRELLHSIKNRIEIIELLPRIGDELLPTLLEDIHVDTQAIIDQYCIMEVA